MMIAACFLAALALVPAPRKVVETGGTTTNAAVTFRFDGSLPKEGYRLNVTDAGAEIAYADGAGKLYARVTLDQLKNPDGATAKAEIEDCPAYPWRGWLIDVGRHFLPKENIFDVLDLMVLHKMNVLHWHLTEDEGWRLPTARHPDLVRYGSQRRYDEPGMDGGRWRRVREWVGDTRRYTYGPHCYSREDIAEVLAYAKARHIRVLPEFDVPGHSRAFIAAYPHLGCEGLGFETNRVCRAKGMKSAQICIGNDEAVQTVLSVFDEMLEMFPGVDLVHIGGDEADTKAWAQCPKCRARMKKEGIADVRALQTWFTRKVIAHLAAKGVRAIGWGEIVQDPGVDPKDVVVMPWLHPDPGQKALGRYCPYPWEVTERGYDVVAASHRFEYWGWPHCRDDEYQPHPKSAYYFPVSLEDTYLYEFDRGWKPSMKGRILGTEGYSWSDNRTAWNFFDFMYSAFPRTCAVAEIAWSNPKPRCYADFHKRMQTHLKRLRAMGVPCAPLDPPGSARADSRQSP